MKENQKDKELQIHHLDRQLAEIYTLHDFLDGETPIYPDGEDRNVLVSVETRL
jgi:hypothetical protein